MSTLLYFTANNLPTISPAFSGMWQSTSGASRHVLSTFKDRIVPAVGSTINIGIGAGSIALDRQYITPGLAGPQTINGVFSGQLPVREFNLQNNVDRVLLCAKVVSNDGAIIRGTLINSGNYGPTLEFINNASLRNKTIASGQAVTNTIAALDGDRIIIEVGYQNSTAGTSPQAAGGYGASAPLMPVDETTTSTFAGWLLLSPTLKFRTTSFVSIEDDVGNV